MYNNKYKTHGSRKSVESIQERATTACCLRLCLTFAIHTYRPRRGSGYPWEGEEHRTRPRPQAPVFRTAPFHII